MNVKAVESVISPESGGKSPSKLMNGIRGGFSQMSVMLEAPHLKNAILVYTIQFCILFGWVSVLEIVAFYTKKASSLQISVNFRFSRLNTFRLWIVQLFAIIKEYETEVIVDSASEANLCAMIEFKVNKTQHTITSVDDNSDVVCEAVSWEKWQLVNCEIETQFPVNLTRTFIKISVLHNLFLTILIFAFVL